MLKNTMAASTGLAHDLYTAFTTGTGKEQIARPLLQKAYEQGLVKNEEDCKELMAQFVLFTFTQNKEAMEILANDIYDTLRAQ